ncbi:hypothetical protein [Cloacibacterium sp.]|uniref:hypothetical protein n=1 Tax=Cloacibacterium sp. TaxID=1913682 RepID=UPI0039E36653
MNKIILTAAILISGISYSQIYTPSGGVNGVTLNTTSGNVGIGTNNPQAKLDISGDLSYGDQQSNTLYRNDAGSYGSNVRSGFYQTYNPVNYPSGATGWWHLLDIRHSNPSNNYALQISGSFFDQNLWYRKTDNQVNQAWRKIVAEQPNGNVGIGTDTPTAKFDVTGTSSFSGNMKVNAKVETKEIKVTATPTADFVFAEDYQLPKLEEVEKHIKEKKHLPEIASAKEMEKEGVNVGEFQIKLLQKIEELTLYSIQLNKENKDLKNSSDEQEKLIKLLIERVEKLESNKK